MGLETWWSQLCFFCTGNSLICALVAGQFPQLSKRFYPKERYQLDPLRTPELQKGLTLTLTKQALRPKPWSNCSYCSRVTPGNSIKTPTAIGAPAFLHATPHEVAPSDNGRKYQSCQGGGFPRIRIRVCLKSPTSH